VTEIIYPSMKVKEVLGRIYDLYFPSDISVYMLRLIETVN